jgi:hypothetical protein
MIGSLNARIGGICAILFVILCVIAGAFAFDSPDTDAPDAEWVDYVKDDSTLLGNIIGAYIFVIAALLFLVFLVAMYQRLRRAGADEGWSMFMLIGGVIWSITMAAGAVLTVTVAGTIKFGSGPEPTAETARWLSQIGFGVWLVVGGLAAAAMLVVMNLLILQTKTLPAWVAMLGFLAAIAMCAAALFIPMAVFALWLVVAGIMLLMSKDEGMAPVTA